MIMPGPSSRRSRSPSPLYTGNSVSELYGRLPSPTPLRFPSPPRPDQEPLRFSRSPGPYEEPLRFPSPPRPDQEPLRFPSPPRQHPEPLRFPSPPRSSRRFEPSPPLRFPSPPRTTRRESPIRSFSPSGRPLSPYGEPIRSSQSPGIPRVPRLPSPIRRSSSKRSPSPEVLEELNSTAAQDRNLANLYDRMDPKDQALLQQFQILQDAKPELPFADYLLVTWDALLYKTRLLQFGVYLGKNRVHFVETITPEDNLFGSAVKGLSTKRIQFEGSGRCLKAINPNARDNDQHKYEVRSLKEAMNNFFDTLEKGLKYQRPNYDGILLFSRYHKDMTHLIKAVKQTGTQEKFKRLIKGVGDLGHYLNHSHPDLHSMDLTQLRMEVLGEYTQGNDWSDVKAQKIYQIIEKLHKGSVNFNFLKKAIFPFESPEFQKMWNSVETVTFEERIQACEPLMKYLEDQIIEQNRSVCLDGIFRPSVDLVSKSMIYKAAHGLCRMLVEADLDFAKLHETFNEFGLDQLELSLRTAFLHKMVGQSRAVVDQVPKFRK